ncbi:MAG: monovalent cation:proton antiporter-2 (CPA2) family protein, partial [Alphaproteobacteria bacterium]
MHDVSYIRGILIFLAAAVVVVPLFQRARTGPVLGYLAAGALIGPYALAFIEDTASVAALAELGVVFLLFAIGLELSFNRLWGMRRYIFGLGSAQVLLTGALITVVAYGFGLTVGAAVVIGGALALSSTAFVIRLLQDRGEHRTRFGRIAIAILLLQDLAVVPLLALVPLLAAAEASIGAAVGLALVKAVAAVTAVVLLGRFVVGPLYRLVAAGRNPELFSAMTLLVVLGTAWITSEAGLSMALGAFLAGLLLSETEYRHQVEADIHPFRALFLGLFFMSVGMSLDFAVLAHRVGEILLVAAALLLGKG